jgi:TPR repeat protein
MSTCSFFFAYWLCPLLALAVDQPLGLEQLDKTLSRPPPIPPQLESSFASLVSSAEKGDARAQCFVGLHYTFGIAVTQDLAKAVQWLHKSANQGFAPGEYSLGWCYKHGFGAATNRTASDEWFRRAAAHGYTPAKHEAALTADRRGNRSEALKLLREAAEKGFPSSQFLLGSVASDPVESYMWHSLAAENGLESAITRKLELRNLLTKDQLAEGEERLSQLKRKRSEQAPTTR